MEFASVKGTEINIVRIVDLQIEILSHEVVTESDISNDMY